MRITLLALLLACDDKQVSDDTGERPGDSAETGESAPIPVDEDGDGHASLETGGDDCDDLNAEIFPGVEEICDEVDQDCDGVVDDAAIDAGTWYADADLDGYGDPDVAVVSCAAPEGYTEDATDCDDDAAGAHPNAEEICNDGLDNDCNGGAEECRTLGELALEDEYGLTGDAGGDTLGYSLSGVGDLDGDGDVEIALGAPGTDGGGSRAGAVRVLRGPVTSAGPEAILDLDGEEASQEAGTALLGADVDGDGVPELIVGGSGAEGGAGLTWILSNPDEGSLAAADARLVGDSSVDEVGAQLATAGDLGLGSASLLIGAPSAGGDVGLVYLIGGELSGDIALGEEATRWQGATIGDAAGPVAGGQDLDGDGVPDACVGAPGQDSAGSAAGALYVLLSVSEGGALEDADATWTGEAASDAAGTAVALLGDIDADGYADLAVGGPNHDEGGDYAGAVWVLRGPASAGGSLLDAEARVTGGASGDSAGSSLAGPGDVDGDGFDELFIGSPWAEGDASNAGRASLLYGPLSGTVSLSDPELVFLGEENLNRAGFAVGSAGDADGDGAQDFLVGAPYFRGTGSDSGKVYLVFGEGI